MTPSAARPVFICATASSRWASAFSGASDSALGQRGFGGSEPRGPIVGEEIERDLNVRGGEADQAVRLAGSSAAARSNRPRAIAKLSVVKPLFIQDQP